jgi:hypothetical protein
MIKTRNQRKETDSTTGRVYIDDNQYKIKEGEERYQGRIASWTVKGRKERGNTTGICVNIKLVDSRTADRLSWTDVIPSLVSLEQGGSIALCRIVSWQPSTMEWHNQTRVDVFLQSQF